MSKTEIKIRIAEINLAVAEAVSKGVNRLRYHLNRVLNKVGERLDNCINARIESIDEKASFKNITHNRCLIIASAYYEWHWNDEKGKSKDKYQINSQDDEIFTFAGLYSSWTDPLTNEIKNTYTMVTTKANGLMQYIHNHKLRMPIMLKRQDESAWLDQSVKIEDFAFPYQGNLVGFQI